MLNIGCHLSASKGYVSMAKDAISIDANVFQFFTRNPRGGKAKDIETADVEKFRQLAAENNFGIILAHAPFTMNACSDDESKRDFANMVFSDDLKRMEYTPNNYYNFHPGSHVGQGVEKGIEFIAEMLNKNLTENQTTTVLLETMAGKGSEVGSRFEELRAIIDKTNLNHKLGVCLDTCHVYDAGYDIVNNLDGVLDEFDRVIGLDRLKAIHLNDSKNPFSSHKDRHEEIGKGSIGLEAITAIINNPRLKNLPFYLETPHDSLDGYGEEIKLLKSLYKE
ncbi:MAG: deoxyribonuclease IV [Oscillospiraceae bacterium]